MLFANLRHGTIFKPNGILQHAVGQYYICEHCGQYFSRDELHAAMNRPPGHGPADRLFDLRRAEADSRMARSAFGEDFRHEARIFNPWSPR